ncbi:MAG: hypothetical protein EOO24_08785 [Comamonadaceae bacterium]|nr:MAG: hypothetical protein EOO24_08785 [Comamonadaceae bacterium]
MRSTTPTFVGIAVLVVGSLAPLLSAQAQGNPVVAPVGIAADAGADAPADPRRNQRIERIRVEDGGATVDELRYGGQTQSISVQPKGGFGSYEVLPNDGTRQRQGSAETSAGGNGPRVWNVLKF